MDAFDQAIALGGEQTPWYVHYNRGRAYNVLRRPQDAILDYQAATVKEPLSAKPGWRLGETYLAKGDLDAAEAAFKLSLAVPMRKGDENAKRRALAGLEKIERRRISQSAGESGERTLPRFRDEADIKRYEAARKWIKDNPDVHHPYHRQTREIRAADGETRTEVVKDAMGNEIWLDENNRPVERDVDRERTTLQTYLDGEYARNPVFNSNFPNYEDYLKTLAGEVPPMKSSCRESSCFPAWMEGKTLHDMLNTYMNQTDKKTGTELDPDLWEVSIIVNRKTGDAPDNSTAEIQRFVTGIQQQRRASGQKEFNIHFVDVEFDPPFNNVGTARKVITDLGMYRSVQRTSQDGPLYLGSEDADIMHVDSHLIYNAITKLDNNPHLDAIQGIQDRMPEVFMENDFLFLQRRLDDFRKRILTRPGYTSEDTNQNYNFRFNRILTSGWNIVHTAESIALAGGYPAGSKQAEDTILGEKITMLRGDGMRPNLSVIGRVGTRVDSSPRRFIAEVATGKPAYSGDQFSSPEVNELIRTKSTEELMQMIKPLARINDVNREKFEKTISGKLKWAARFSPDPQEFSHSMMFWLGFKRNQKDVKGNPIPDDYTVGSNGEVRIANWSNVENAMHDYRTRHTRQRRPGETQRHHVMPEGQFPTFPKRFTLEELRTSSRTEERGDYVLCLDKAIGEGWHGRVVAGYNKATGEVVAVKVTKKDYLEGAYNRNINEPGITDPEDYVRRQVPVSDPSLLLYREKFESGDSIIKVYPSVSVNLEKQIQQAGRIAPEYAVVIMQRLLKGVQTLHNAGIGHLDLHPGNILFDDQGNAYISDFDEATRESSTQNQFLRPNLQVSPEIRPPEADPGSPFQGLTKSTDIYEMGVSLYFMSTGRYPFDPKRENEVDRSKVIQEIKNAGITDSKKIRTEYIKRLKQAGNIVFPDDVPAHLQEVIRKALQYNPANRYQSASEMADALRTAA